LKVVILDNKRKNATERNSQLYILIQKPNIKDTMAEKTIDDYDFAAGDAGASHIYNEEAGQIRVGG
jgi:hypothetical protein